MSAAHQFKAWLASDRKQYRIALRTLYRQVSKRVHPDLTTDEADRRRRERLMGEANQAYELGDSNRLRTILEEYELRPASLQQSGMAADLVSVARGITLKLRLQLTLMGRFSDDRMKHHRSLLAQHLLFSGPHGRTPEEVLNFFEELRLFLHARYLDEELVWSTFGFSAVRWWAVCKVYVLGERERRNDRTLFAGFQNLAMAFSKRDAQAGFQEPTLADLKLFLEDERKLTSTRNASIRYEHMPRPIHSTAGLASGLYG